MTDIDIKSSTIDKSLELAKNFLQKLIGPSVDELGLLFSDNIKIWRLQNQVINLKKVKEIVDRDNIRIKQVNLKVLVPYLEGVSLEDEESLQDIWANLFANYIDASKNLTVNVYPSILKQLSSNEVSILKYMQSNRNKLIFTDDNPSKENQFTPEKLSNLERLGIVRKSLDITQYGGGIDENNGQWKWDFEESRLGEFYITDFGFEFLNACERQPSSQ